MVVFSLLCYCRRAVNQQLHDFGVPIKIDPIADPEVLLHGGEELKFGDCTIQCILSPGHSEGSIVYYVQRGAETFLVTGDVLFTYSIGRTECAFTLCVMCSWSGIPILRNTSSLADLTKSIRRLEVCVLLGLHCRLFLKRRLFFQDMVGLENWEHRSRLWNLCYFVVFVGQTPS